MCHPTARPDTLLTARLDTVGAATTRVLLRMAGARIGVCSDMLAV